MKLKRLYLLTFLTLLILLCGCGKTSATSVQPSTEPAKTMTDVWRENVWYHIEPISVEHGEDYAIEWEDSGVEAAVRVFLQKPEGTIMHSDVWDIQVLSIGYSGGYALSVPPDGWEKFCFEGIQWNKNVGQSYGETEVPKPVTLKDLAHFDSLQMLSLPMSQGHNGFVGEVLQKGSNPIDLTGLEECENLKYFSLKCGTPNDLEPLTGAKALKYCELVDCGDLDLTPLEDLPELTNLNLSGSRLKSLESLTTLPKLDVLLIGREAEYPALEPLTRTSVRFLDMGLSVWGRDMYNGLDYGSLAKIPNLEFLDISNHMSVDEQLVKIILNECSNLKYLDISYTPATRNSKFLDTNRLENFVDTR